MPDKLVKHGRMAHSGVYDYTDKEVKGIDISWPPPSEIGEKPMYHFYRPMPVFVEAVKDGLFTNMPITRGHPGWVDPVNFRDHAIGFTGETAELEYMKDSGEVSVNGTLTLHDAVALESYDRGVVELSPYYHAKFEWRKGQHKGQPYDAVMTKITQTNSLGLVNKGRGGSASAIMDHAAQGFRKIASGLWWAVKRRTMVKDEAAGDGASEEMGFKSSLEMLCSQRASMSEEEIHDRIEQLKILLADLPYGEEKDMLLHFMDDLKLMKMMPEGPVTSAIELSCALFDKLDSGAMSEVRSVFGDEAQQEDEMRNMLAELLGNIKSKKKTEVKDESAELVEPKDIPDSDDEEGSGAVCPTCGGTGKMGKGETVHDCQDCGGSGKRTAGDTHPVDQTNKVDQTNVLDAKPTGDEPDPAVPPATPGATPAQTPSPSPNGVPVAAPGPAPSDGSPQPVGAGPSPANAAPSADPNARAVYYVQQIAALMDQIAKDPLMQQLKQMPAAGQSPAPSDGAGTQPVNSAAAPATAAPPATAPAASPAPAGAKPAEPKPPADAPASAGAPPAPEEKKPAPPVSKNEKPAKAAGDEAPPGCEPCKGTGKIAGMICPQCKGSGKPVPLPDPVSDSASSLTALISSSRKVGSASEPLTLGNILENITKKRR